MALRKDREPIFPLRTHNGARGAFLANGLHFRISIPFESRAHSHAWQLRVHSHARSTQSSGTIWCWTWAYYDSHSAFQLSNSKFWHHLVLDVSLLRQPFSFPTFQFKIQIKLIGRPSARQLPKLQPPPQEHWPSSRRGWGVLRGEGGENVQFYCVDQRFLWFCIEKGCP